jgi:hypothetical protein
MDAIPAASVPGRISSALPSTIQGMCHSHTFFESIVEAIVYGRTPAELQPEGGQETPQLCGTW